MATNLSCITMCRKLTTITASEGDGRYSFDSKTMTTVVGGVNTD